MSTADEAYDRLHGLDGYTQAESRTAYSPRCDCGPVLRNHAADCAVLDGHTQATCRDCGHRHTPGGCSGPATPSDRWAGVSPAVCDCPATHPPAEEPCPACGGSMRFCECMDDPFAPAGPECSTCGCGVAGDGNCPCGCGEAAERTREAFALGAAWALGDDEEAPAALRARIEQASAERDRYRTAWKSAVTRAGLAADRHAELLAKVEALADDFASNVDWSAGRNNYGDNEAWESAARQVRALLEDDER